MEHAISLRVVPVFRGRLFGNNAENITLDPDRTPITYNPSKPNPTLALCLCTLNIYFLELFRPKKHIKTFY